MVSPAVFSKAAKPHSLSLTAVPLDDEKQAQKEVYLNKGFLDWSRHNFQQFVQVEEANR
ncbi:hypothetical protein HWV62_4399, partial [Athelia sp. TMB]